MDSQVLKQVLTFTFILSAALSTTLIRQAVGGAGTDAVLAVKEA